jgi:hypothetical protein
MPCAATQSSGQQQLLHRAPAVARSLLQPLQCVTSCSRQANMRAPASLSHLPPHSLLTQQQAGKSLELLQA